MKKYALNCSIYYYTLKDGCHVLYSSETYSDDLDEIWEAWTITPLDKIERKPFALVEEDPYKVTIDGERYYEGDIRKTDISKPIKTLRWRR